MKSQLKRGDIVALRCGETLDRVYRAKIKECYMDGSYLVEVGRNQAWWHIQPSDIVG